MSFLIYVNALGPNYKGDNIYEFIFGGDVDNVEGDYWDYEPSGGKPTPPHIEFIESVGVLNNSEINLNLIQNSDFFSVYDAVENVISMAWESTDSEYVTNGYKRLVFHYGENINSVKDKLYERDIVLKFDKNLVENE